MPAVEDHDYVVRGTSTATFGRVLVNARDQHLVVDGPIHNGCPGEAMTPVEVFLGGVVGCAVELVQAVARDRGIQLAEVKARMGATIDRAHAVRSDLTLFSSATLQFTFRGIGDEDAAALVKAFKGG